MSETQFFNPILENEKTSLISYIQKNNVECIIKIYDSHLKTQFLKTDKNIIQVFKRNNFKINSEKIIISFESVGDKFFFTSLAHSDESKLNIDLPDEIYKLQRRNDFRVSIPSSIVPIIKLKDYPDLKTSIRDLSLGGCKISLKTEFKLDFTLDSETQIKIKVLDFDEPTLNVVIKFIDHIEDSKTTILGLQFLDLTSDQTALMRNTLLQIDRILRHKTDD